MKLRKIKLSDLSDAGLKDKAMSALVGGICCSCSCYWEGRGGSSYMDNSAANYKFGGVSKEGCNEYVYCDEPNEAVPLPSAGI